MAGASSKEVQDPAYRQTAFFICQLNHVPICPKTSHGKKRKPIGERISALLARTIRFVTYDIWRITENEVSGLKEIYINIIKTVILAVRGFQSENLQTKASALTYSTLLSIVPLLAVLLGIAKGFGFQGTVRQELFDYFPRARRWS